MKSIGPWVFDVGIEWVFDVVVVVIVVVVLFLFLLLSTSPSGFMIFVTRAAFRSHPGHKYHETTWAFRVGC